MSEKTVTILTTEEIEFTQNESQFNSILKIDQTDISANLNDYNGVTVGFTGKTNNAVASMADIDRIEWGDVCFINLAPVHKSKERIVELINNHLEIKKWKK